MGAKQCALGATGVYRNKVDDLEHGGAKVRLIKSLLRRASDGLATSVLWCRIPLFLNVPRWCDTRAYMVSEERGTFSLVQILDCVCFIIDSQMVLVYVVYKFERSTGYVNRSILKCLHPLHI